MARKFGCKKHQKAYKYIQICAQIWGRCRDAPENGSTVAFTVRGLDAFGLLRGKLWVRKLPSYFSGAFKACRWMFLIFFVCLVVRLFVRSSIHSFILSILYSFTCLLLYSFTHSTHTHTDVQYIIIIVMSFSFHISWICIFIIHLFKSCQVISLKFPVPRSQ